VLTFEDWHTSSTPARDAPASTNRPALLPMLDLADTGDDGPPDREEIAHESGVHASSAQAAVGVQARACIRTFISRGTGNAFADRGSDHVWSEWDASSSQASSSTRGRSTA